MPQLDASAFWGIGGMIVGIIVAAFFFFIGKKKTLMQYVILTTPLITKKMTGILNDRMSIDGQSIKSLFSTTITFVNSGNQRIQSSDFSNEQPFCIILKGHIYGYDVSRGNQPLLPKVKSANNVLNISFENLKPRQFFRVTILHDGTLDVSGELTTGTMRKFRSKFKTIASYMVGVLMTAVMFVSILIFDSLYDSHIMETMFKSYLSALILVFIPLIINIVIFTALLSYEEPFLRDNGTNKSVKKGRSLL